MDDLGFLLQTLALDEEGLYRQWLSLGSALNIVAAVIFGFLILFLYRRTAPKGHQDRNLYTVLPVLTVLMTLLMRVDGAPAAFFFGVCGVLSIIRFRSDLTDQTGITFILFSVIQGILLGAGNYLLALVGFVLVSGAIIVSRLLHTRNALFTVTVRVAGDLGAARTRLQTWFEEQGLTWRLISLQAAYEDNKVAVRVEKRRLDYELSLQAHRAYEDAALSEALLALAREHSWELEFRSSGG